MRPLEFGLLQWIRNYSRQARYNLTASGLPEPVLAEFGIKHDYTEFLAETNSGEDAEHSFVRSVSRTYGVPEDSVLPTIGGSEAIFLVLLKLGAAFRKVTVPLPNYEPLFRTSLALGLEVTPNVSKDIPVAVTHANNPTGRGLNPEYLASLKENSGYLYVDETFKDFLSPENPSTLFTRDGQVITSGSMTKFYGLGRFRLGWIIADPELIEELRSYVNLIRGGCPGFSLWIGSQVFSKRSLFARRAKEIVDKNHELVRSFVESIPSVTWSDPEGPPICLVRYRSSKPSVDFCLEVLGKCGVLLAPGDYFGEPHSFRLCFTNPDAPGLAQGLSKLSEYLSSVA